MVRARDGRLPAPHAVAARRDRRAACSPSSSRGSCFAGTLARAGARRRPLLHAGAAEGDNDAPRIALSAANFGPFPMANGLTRLATAVLRRARAGRAHRASSMGEPLDAAAALELGPRHLRARRARLGGRDAPRHRGARQPVARRAHRARGEPALRRARDAWRRASSRGFRPGRTGSSAGPTPSASMARSSSSARGTQAAIRSGKGVTMAIDYQERIPNNVDLADNRTPAARARALAAAIPRLVARDGARPISRPPTSICAPPPRSIRKGWATLRHVKMPDYRWGIFLAEPESRPPHRLRRRDRQAGVAAGAGRASHHLAPPDRHARRHRARLGRAAAPARPHRAVALRSAQPVPGQRRGRPPSLGDGLSAPRLFRARRARGGGGDAGAPFGRRDKPRILATFNEPIERLALASSCSPTSPTATASSS